ncbi:MAG: leucyl/phenylalanyl-tRNA--protein transferase [Pyrinomonadaceae bacterium]
MSSIPDPSNHYFQDWVLFGEYYYQARDIVGFGYPLTLENIADAYRKGVFPWPIEGMPLPWFCPEKRAVLFFRDLKVSKSLAKEKRKGLFRYSIDEAFSEVVENCRDSYRKDQEGTWITDDYLAAINGLHKKGMAHSVEVWEGDELVGGLYGVDAGGVFSGESMFYLRSNASKLALLFLIEHLAACDAEFIDTQVMTPHFRRFGAVEIPREEFLARLRHVQESGIKLF